MRLYRRMVRVTTKVSPSKPSAAAEPASATSPATYGVAKLVPSSGRATPSASTSLVINSGPAEDSDTAPVPGAATSTHGPRMEKSAASPLSSVAATVSTSSSNQPGEEIVVTMPVLFCLQVSLALAAATTTTTSRSTAWCTAACRSGALT